MQYSCHPKACIPYRARRYRVGVGTNETSMDGAIGNPKLLNALSKGNYIMARGSKSFLSSVVGNVNGNGTKDAFSNAVGTLRDRVASVKVIRASNPNATNVPVLDTLIAASENVLAVADLVKDATGEDRERYARGLNAFRSAFL